MGHVEVSAAFSPKRIFSLPPQVDGAQQGRYPADDVRPRRVFSQQTATGRGTLPTSPSKLAPYTLRVTSDRQDETVPGQSRQSGSSQSKSSDGAWTPASRDSETPEPERSYNSNSTTPITQFIPFRRRELRTVSSSVAHSQKAEISSIDSAYQTNSSVENAAGGNPSDERRHAPSNGLQSPDLYPRHHSQQGTFDDSPKKRDRTPMSGSPTASPSGQDSTPTRSAIPELQLPRTVISRPVSAYTLGSETSFRGRANSPRLSPHYTPGHSPSPSSSPRVYARNVSASRRSPESRPVSYIDLLNNIPYSQQLAPAPNLDNAKLRNAVGTNASLLDSKKTLEMYRANVKKTNDPAIQYEFAIFMVQTARDIPATGQNAAEGASAQAEMLREARHILQRLADRSYPFAQYYLGDGYSSGLFNKGKEDWDRAFPLFVAASKHGHAEAGYRAALCYEFGWGCRKDYAKAVQFYRASASKNHPGAATRLGKACLTGDMGLGNRYREGVKWLKRAAESADFQYNSGPYELGLLHVTGYGDDIFKDEAYAAQLFTQSADLGHADANLKMGEAYEHGLLGCPKDPALSVHFYNGAAQAGVPEAMMALCAWYMVGAEPVLDKDENEAYEWAKKAADSGFVKAEYAVGYFTEMGIGCRRDPLEANVWYVRAADEGDERAKQRLAIIRAAASGDPGIPSAAGGAGGGERAKLKKTNSGKDDKDCVVM